MGQNQSVFIYSPLKYVEYVETLSPDVTNKLESFLFHTLTKSYNSVIDNRWREIVIKMCHKIKCVSEGWKVLPTIHFTIDEKGIVCVKKIMDSV